MARDLLARAESARASWRTPAIQRAAITPEQLATARDNAQALRHIVARNRWPGRSLVGEEACQAAVLIALHADHDTPFQHALLRLLHEAARSGEATFAQWAHLHDRCLVHTARQQMYGTQYWYRPDGRLEPHPIADPGNLDARRTEVGLPPFAEAAERLRRHHTNLSSLSNLAVTAVAPTKTVPSQPAPVETILTPAW
jgi:hypothetical protein